ncbi:MarR family winged helix-turn-helix transcriptional regulator [Corticibacter populi]|nr:MarR family transcriptional regulator [Corticibacter populi]RZS31579.1 MarR family transcriptional regulator for hemolysin [Corticibacter populi]
MTPVYSTPSIGDYEALGALAGQLNRLWRKAINEILAPLGLTEATWRPLIYIHRARQNLSQNDLADLMGLDRSSIVRLLDSLEKAQLTVRQEDTADRRVKRLHLTDEGRQIALQAEDASAQLHRRVFAAIPADVLATTQAGLLEIQRLLGNHQKT